MRVFNLMDRLLISMLLSTCAWGEELFRFYSEIKLKTGDDVLMYRLTLPQYETLLYSATSSVFRWAMRP